MKSYTGATLLLNENGSWWLQRGVSSPYTTWVDTSSGKTIETPKDFDEPWQVPALGGMPEFTDIQAAVDRILPKDIFKVRDMVVLKEEEPAYFKGNDAFIYVRLESVKKSDRHLATTNEYRLFSPAELEVLEQKTSDSDYNKLTFKFMASLSGDSAPDSSPDFSGAFVAYKSQHELPPNEPVTTKTFYVPMILNGFDMTNAGYLLGSERVNGSPQALTYASRVMPGQTLQQAVAKDLQQDFHYDGRFIIDSSYYSDTRQDKKGVNCDRYIVNIILRDNYTPNDIKLFDKKLTWILPS